MASRVDSRRPRFWLRRLVSVLFLGALLVLLAGCTGAESVDGPRLTVGVGGTEGPQNVSSALQILVLLSVLSLAPAVLVMMTSFTRIVIVLALLRQALGLAQTPPNQIIIGLALFLSLFVMAPVLQDINEHAFQPYSDGTIQQDEAVNRGLEPLRRFMLRQTREKDIALFLEMGKIERPRTPADVPTHALVPAFVTQRVENGLSDGIPGLHPVPGDRHGGGRRPDVDGHDDAAADDDLAAVQATAVRAGGRLVSGGQFARGELQLGARGACLGRAT